MHRKYHELVDESEKGHEFRQVPGNLLFMPKTEFVQATLLVRSLSEIDAYRLHYALAALQYTDLVRKLITQNVDGLHQRAISIIWPASRVRDRIAELHGTLHVSYIHVM